MTASLVERALNVRRLRGWAVAGRSIVGLEIIMPYLKISKTKKNIIIKLFIHSLPYKKILNVTNAALPENSTLAAALMRRG